MSDDGGATRASAVSRLDAARKGVIGGAASVAGRFREVAEAFKWSAISARTGDQMTISDGFGNEEFLCGPGCHKEAVRPGKFQCCCEEHELQCYGGMDLHEIWGGDDDETLDYKAGGNMGDLIDIHTKTRRKILDDHEAIDAHGDGISTEALVDFQGKFSNYAATRLHGKGVRKYLTEQGQRFEEYDLDQLEGETLDELADVVNYATMMAVKILAARR